MLRISIGTCTCRCFLLQYLVLEVSVKIGISAVLLARIYCYSHVMHRRPISEDTMHPPNNWTHRYVFDQACTINHVNTRITDFSFLLYHNLITIYVHLQDKILTSY